MSAVSPAQIKTPPTTSIKVCHNLSFKRGVLIHMSSIPHSSSPIFFKNFACCPASYLTFAASYRNKKEKQKARAKAVESIPCSNHMTVVILAAIPLCTEGNPPALRNALRWSFFAAIRSMTSLTTCMMHHTAIGTRNFGTMHIIWCKMGLQTDTVQNFLSHIQSTEELVNCNTGNTNFSRKVFWIYGWDRYSTISCEKFFICQAVVLILVLWAILVIVGLFAVYSVSVFESFWLTLYWVEEGLRTDPTNYFYFFEQLTNIGVWLAVCLVIFFLPRRHIKKLKNVIFLLTLGAVFLLFTPLAETYKWATAWLDLWFTNIQPGEFFKLGFVFFLWSWLLRKRSVMNELTRYMWFLIITGICYIIFVLIPDLWTVYVLAPVSLLMFWYAWGKKSYIALTLLLWIGAMFLAALQFDHIRIRLDYYLYPSKYEDNRDVWRQNKQALLAIGWWWWVGKWYGKWLQKFGYLPEAQSDFIFAALGEEIGVIGIGIILALYLALARVVLKKLPTLPDEEDQLLVVGLLSLIIMQAFINMWVNMSLLPLTWLTLPFFSHGGSALLVNMAELMLIWKVFQKR